MSKICFYTMTQAAYDSLSSKNNDALYFTTDTKMLFRGANAISPSGVVARGDKTIRISAGETFYNIYAFGATASTTWNGEFQVYGSVYGCYCMGATINVGTGGYICNALVTEKTAGQTSWEGGLQLSSGKVEHVIVEGGHMYLNGDAKGFDIEVQSGARLMISGDTAEGNKILVRSGGRLQLYKGSALNVLAESGAALSISDGTTITYA